jgi:hypothetical protein
VYSGMSTVSTNLSNLSRYRLASIGETIEPWGQYCELKDSVGEWH